VVPQHFIQRGSNREATFFADEDNRYYLDWLIEAASATKARLSAH
jgi:putative transposase